ncbi:SDR family NAD(P)-dependent oxidoreductase [Mycobacterium terramassiliense]|uniref:Short-chain dehydrogenase n=1 Tax=Mycobacterium terramassiliense TaxID=1841859 RepID=A0A2U3NB06_9MYCO|nr:SDR family NAD(P)-dependent oxidoreductase [Mycobacterium terramassiliense]SPM28689.1 Short-chain dehydrogenase [Mycobacterium terramassiliense]
MRINAHRFGPWAVVTGASSGIGREFAHQLADAGINVVLVARRLAVLQELGPALARGYGVDYRAVGVDLSDPGMLTPIIEATNDIDVGLLVSNAGEALPGPFVESDLQAQRAILRLNTAAHLGLSHHFGERMARRGRGGIVLVSALGATHGVPYLAHTAATKAYVSSLGAGLHGELAKQGVHVTVLHPGPTRTPALAVFGLDPDKMPISPMAPEVCAREALRALERNRANCIPGRVNRVTAALVPASVTRSMMSRMLLRPSRVETASR